MEFNPFGPNVGLLEAHSGMDMEFNPFGPNPNTGLTGMDMEFNPFSDPTRGSLDPEFNALAPKSGMDLSSIHSLSAGLTLMSSIKFLALLLPN